MERTIRDPHGAGPERTAVGWVGVGLMGRSMCRRLLEAGYRVALTSRTRTSADDLVASGATWADTPAAVAAQSDVVFSMVAVPADVRQVTLGDDGALAGCRPGTVLVDMTTSEPSLAVEIAERAAVQDVAALDAPVSGGDVGAREGTLSIMVGGDRAAFARVLPCFEVMGTTVVHQGGPGAGQHTKMVNQILIAGTMVGLCEALLYGHRAGLDLEVVLQSVAKGAAASWSLDKLAPRVLAGDFAPGFLVDHFVKDLGIALAEARRMRIAVPGLALAEQLYVMVQARGHGRDGTHALQLALATLSDVQWPHDQ
ncbi:MAG: NAD(P)-dependent oxidoreductase [Acidimicrobiales bacterium]